MGLDRDEIKDEPEGQNVEVKKDKPERRDENMIKDKPAGQRSGTGT